MGGLPAHEKEMKKTMEYGSIKPPLFIKWYTSGFEL